MPTRRGGARQPSRRIERPAKATASEPSNATPAPHAPAKVPARNPLFGVGVSLYPLDNETSSTDEWYARDYSTDLDLLAEARCTFVRLFVSWRVLEPQVGQYSEEALETLVGLVDAARQRKIQSVICFFADDRHAELSEVPWGKRRDARTDPYLVQREVALVAKVASRLSGTGGVFAWQLGNEAFLSGFADAEALREWVSSLREAIREHDPKRPIGVGADAETLYRSTGVDARSIIDSCDFAVAHLTSSYRAYASEGPLTSGPSTYLEPFLLRLAHRGSPVMLDEVGPLSLDYSVGQEADYLRVVLWSAVCNRGAGVLARRLRDMETERREPYFLDEYETLVGLVDSDGERKPSYEALSSFVRLAARLDLNSYSLIAERSAVLVPSERYAQLPSLAGLFAPRSCFQAFVQAKQAHLAVSLAHEEDEFENLRLIIIPSVFSLSDATWSRLAAFVQAGGAVVMSYGGGDAPPEIRELFGIDFLGDGGPRDTLSCRIAQPDMLGPLESFDVAFDLPNFALLTNSGATVVATDEKGSPLLTVNQVGQGRAIYIAASIERAIAQGDPWTTPKPVSHMVREVYSAAARAAGCGSPVACDVAEVEVSLFQGEGEDIVVLINHARESATANLTVERRVSHVTDIRGGAPAVVGGTTFGVPIQPCGVSVLRLTYA